MPVEARERRKLRRLEQGLPLTFRWYQGRTIPDVADREMVLYEDLGNDSAAIVVRRGAKRYVLFGGVYDPGDSTVNPPNVSHPIIVLPPSGTPDVSDGNYFETNNTSPVTITNFAGGVQGQQIWVRFGDSNTTLDFTSSSLKGNALRDAPTMTEGSFMTAVYDGVRWNVFLSELGDAYVRPSWDLVTWTGKHTFTAEMLATSGVGIGDVTTPLQAMLEVDNDDLTQPALSVNQINSGSENVFTFQVGTTDLYEMDQSGNVHLHNAGATGQFFRYFQHWLYDPLYSYPADTFNPPPSVYYTGNTQNITGLGARDAAHIEWYLAAAGPSDYNSPTVVRASRLFSFYYGGIDESDLALYFTTGGALQNGLTSSSFVETESSFVLNGSITLDTKLVIGGSVFVEPGVVTTTPYTVQITDNKLIAEDGSEQFNLPAVGVNSTYIEYHFFNVKTPSVNPVDYIRINANGTDTIAGAAFFDLPINNGLRLTNDGTDTWYGF